MKFLRILIITLLSSCNTEATIEDDTFTLPSSSIAVIEFTLNRAKFSNENFKYELGVNDTDFLRGSYYCEEDSSGSTTIVLFASDSARNPNSLLFGAKILGQNKGEYNWRSLNSLTITFAKIIDSKLISTQGKYSSLVENGFFKITQRASLGGIFKMEFSGTISASAGAQDISIKGRFAGRRIK